MASSYWDSTQRRNWTYTKPELADIRKKLEDSERVLVSQYPLPDRRLLSQYFAQQLQKLGKPLSVRQQALATAQIYIRRFYTKVEIRRTNPLLVVATALYLACKMEECPQHIRLLSAEANHNWPDFGPKEPSRIGECEFALIAEMNSQLIIHHPYRSMTELQSSFPLSQEENNLAWNIINDHYLTDLPLLHAPHLIAITAMVLAVVLRPQQSTHQVHAANVANALQALSNPKAAPGANGPGGANIQIRIQKLITWLAESSADIEAIVDCTQELISLYEVWDQYNEKVCREQINRFVKGKGLEK
ncbi:C/H/G cyclin [Pseudovirgaria hyperparasitica]|uniref:RNA polymerase II holoenzyme cyclin-like subunit n=1 Tax=Pseudovirgaria hyperparasitica TaxID=470096 RepID=A0A6A6WIB3_9PEZI|nr:C/H/G cyclin [Pseudovirgaria hyperparasitica]KAF2761804.1 C/H/G cyclin [Pseudovirgaria hyperparasitica]